MKRCNNCGVYNNYDDQFCFHCNNNIDTKILVCEKCGRKTDRLIKSRDGKKICGYCCQWEPIVF
jgi:hypothetical protein